MSTNIMTMQLTRHDVGHIPRIASLVMHNIFITPNGHVGHQI